MSTLRFSISHTHGAARRGVLTTPHGIVNTPAFMPVGTQGTVKAVTHRDLEDLDAEIVLANTYHLYLRPGADRIGRLGGLHKFIGWSRPILTDSGGYQVFSLAERRKIHEEGATFRSHLDGSEHLLTPESAVDIQGQLGSDVSMVLDECLEYPAAHDRARESLERTLRWAKRGRDHFVGLRSRMSGPTASMSRGPDPNSQMRGRLNSASSKAAPSPTCAAKAQKKPSRLASRRMPLAGWPSESRFPLITTSPSRPRSGCLPIARATSMGVGTPADLVECVARGIDMFDCVLPTRNARNGQLFTRTGRLNIKNAEFADDENPVDAECACYTCRHFSRAYLRHLFQAGEMTAGTLNTLHNLHFYLDTMRRVREAIVFSTLEEVRQRYRRIFPA